MLSNITILRESFPNNRVPVSFSSTMLTNEYIYGHSEEEEKIEESLEAKVRSALGK